MGRKEDISRLLAGDDERIFYGKSKEKDEMFLSILPIVSGRLEGVLICAHAYYCIILTPHGRGIFFLSLGIKKCVEMRCFPRYIFVESAARNSRERRGADALLLRRFGVYMGKRIRHCLGLKKQR